MAGFQVYATMDQRLPPSRVAAHARRAEGLGFDGLAVPDAVHDALVAAALALAATRRLRVATHVLVAFPRSPMNVAIAAWDLQALSGGRFELGLGSQVRANVVERYGGAWSAPVPRMREYLAALGAVFASFQDGVPLRFEGEHHRLTRLQPFFRPDPLPGGPPPLLLGGIGPGMVALAGEACHGLVTHPTHSTPRALRETVGPRLAAGAARTGRDPAELARVVTPLPVTGPDPETLDRERERVRQLLGFLYSTPAYWESLELFGWRERGERLQRLTREGRWDGLAAVVDDEMLETLAPVAPYEGLVERLRAWYQGLGSALALPMPADEEHDPALRPVIEALRSGA